MGEYRDEAEMTRSDWLSRAMDDLDQRDPLDAYNDALRLVEVCKTRLKTLEIKHGVKFNTDE